MKKRLTCWALALTSFIAMGAHADEAAVRKGVQAKFPKMAVESVSKTPFAGVYEVVLDGQILFLGTLFEKVLVDERDHCLTLTFEEGVARLKQRHRVFLLEIAERDFLSVNLNQYDAGGSGLAA